MQGLKKLLLKEQKKLEMICSKVENELKSVPKGNLRISKDKNKIRYYHCVEDNEGTYISKIDSELPKLHTQRQLLVTPIEPIWEKELVGGMTANIMAKNFTREPLKL